jgi:uncharacterized protein
MRILLDTNVLASAAATRGLCADVLREAMAEHELVLCPQILSELRRVLRDKFHASRALVDDFLETLEQDSVHAEPGELPAIKLRDKDDLGILAAAKSSGVRLIVTGDKELLSLGRFAGMAIVSPRQFWEELTG